MKIPKIQNAQQIFPAVLAFVTQRERYLPEITWHSKLWSYNAFRLFELIFWRRYGVRLESSVIRQKLPHSPEIIVRRFYTWEALVVHAEVVVRDFVTLPKLGFKFVPIPQWSMVGGHSMPVLPPIFSFAIAFDNAASTNANVATLAQTVTGTNPSIFMSGDSIDNTSHVTGISYAGAAGTQVAAEQQPNGAAGRKQKAFYKGGCSTGSNNIVVTTSNSTPGVYIAGSSYSGVSSGAVDGSDSGENATTGNCVSTITPSAANCWHVMTAQSAQGNKLSSGTNATQRTIQVGAFGMWDSNGAITAGVSHSVTVTSTDTLGSCWQGATIAPPTTVNANFLAFM